MSPSRRLRPKPSYLTYRLPLLKTSDAQWRLVFGLSMIEVLPFFLSLSNRLANLLFLLVFVFGVIRFPLHVFEKPSNINGLGC